MTERRRNPPIALSIAGSDSGGGAGIQADMLTFAAHGVFATTAITAVTAQNTTAVDEVTVLPASAVRQQVETVLDDLPPAATKTGMLATAEIVALVADLAARLPLLVVDPVLVASSGARLLADDARDAYLDLFAHATVVTPNIPEAEYLTDIAIQSVNDMERAARALASSGALVVVKGGHLPGEHAIDVVCDASGVTHVVTQKVPTENVHGTGCTLSSAIAANLARGFGGLDAVRAAKAYVTACLEAARAWDLGAGNGPVNHAPRAPTGPA